MRIGHQGHLGVWTVGADRLSRQGAERGRPERGGRRRRGCMRTWHLGPQGPQRVEEQRSRQLSTHQRRARLPVQVPEPHDDHAIPRVARRPGVAVPLAGPRLPADALAALRAVWTQWVPQQGIDPPHRTGIQGVVNLCFALPAGVLADRIGRSALLRAAAVVALVACAYMAVCLLYLKGRVSDDTLYYALCGASALWGVFMGLHSSPLAALFADSIESGARSKLYVWRSSLRTAGNAVGPLVSIVVFSILGDEWRVDELTYVLLGGVGAI